LYKYYYNQVGYWGFYLTNPCFSKVLLQRKEIENNLFVKKFFKGIIYSKENIRTNLYLLVDFEDLDFSFLAGQIKRKSEKFIQNFPPKIRIYMYTYHMIAKFSCLRPEQEPLNKNPHQGGVYS
jgi:hypothetical protein